MKNRMSSWLFCLAGFMVLGGALGRLFFGSVAAYVFLSGSLLFAVMQYLGRYRGHSFVIRRLTTQQLFGAVALVLAGVLMFSTNRNEWVLAMTVGALLELYTSFRIAKEMEGEQ